MQRSVQSLNTDELIDIEAVIAMDCTWHQVGEMLRSVPSDLNFIRLQGYKTTFWRYQHLDESCLATVESIYYFYKEYKEARQCKGIAWPADSNIDDLLFLYSLQYHNLKEDNMHREQVNPGGMRGKHREYIQRVVHGDKGEEGDN